MLPKIPTTSKKEFTVTQYNYSHECSQQFSVFVRTDIQARTVLNPGLEA